MLLKKKRENFPKLKINQNKFFLKIQWNKKKITLNDQEANWLILVLMYQKHKEKQLNLPDLVGGFQSFISCLEKHGYGKVPLARGGPLSWCFRHQKWSLELTRGQHPLCCSRALARRHDGVCCALQWTPNKQPTLVSALPHPPSLSLSHFLVLKRSTRVGLSSICCNMSCRQLSVANPHSLPQLHSQMPGLWAKRELSYRQLTYPTKNWVRAECH